MMGFEHVSGHVYPFQYITKRVTVILDEACLIWFDLQYKQ